MTVTARWAGQGLAAGQPLTTSLAGSGDTAFTALSGTSGAVTATGGPGPSGIRLNFTPSGAASYMEWGSAVVGSLTAMAVRCYYRFSAWPSSSFTILRGLTAGGAQQWGVDLGGTGSPGQVRLRNAANTANTAASANGAISVATDLRFEVLWDSSGATTVYVYSGNSTTALATLTGNTGGTSPIGMIRLGPISGPTLGQYYASDIALANAASLIGPAQAAAASTIKYWDGATLKDVTLRGMWDGTALQPAVLRS
jgi:hypothetical protein